MKISNVDYSPRDGPLKAVYLRIQELSEADHTYLDAILKGVAKKAALRCAPRQAESPTIRRYLRQNLGIEYTISPEREATLDCRLGHDDLIHILKELRKYKPLLEDGARRQLRQLLRFHPELS